MTYPAPERKEFLVWVEWRASLVWLACHLVLLLMRGVIDALNVELVVMLQSCCGSFCGQLEMVPCLESA